MANVLRYREKLCVPSQNVCVRLQKLRSLAKILCSLLVNAKFLGGTETF